MNATDIAYERLAELLGIAVDGKLTKDERSELNQILRDSEDAQGFFHRYIDLHTELQWMLNPEVLNIPTGLDTIPFDPQASANKPSGRKRLTALAISGWVGLAAAFAVLMVVRQPQSELIAHSGLSSENIFVARANYSSDAILAKLSTVTRQGDWVSPGKIVLEQGTLGLTFDSGALVVLNAPAEFDIETSSRAFLHSGQAVAQVPEPAIGFIINTPNSTIVDLGTEFTVSVDEGESTVKVLEGEVQAYATNTDGQTHDVILTENQAVRINEATEEAFSDAHDFEYTEFHDWTLFYEPDAKYVHFDFETSKNRINSTGTWGKNYRGGFRPLNWDKDSTPDSVPGVFGNGLRFDGDGRFIASDFEGISGAQARTVACWVRIPPNVKNPAASIVSWGEHRRGKHWQIGINNVGDFGTVGAIRTDFSSGYVTGSTDLRDGRWHHIVSVYIGGNSPDIAAHVRHYVDGKLEPVSGIKQLPVDIDTTTDTERSIDNLKIGYRKRKAQDSEVMNGAIDELYIFDAAILPSQITNLKDFNSPNNSQTALAAE